MPPDSEAPEAPEVSRRHAHALPLLLLAAVFIGAMLAVPALAPTQELAAQEAPPADAAMPASDPAALALLRRAASLGVSRSWKGVEVLAATGTATQTQVISVQHRALVGTDLTVLDGAASGSVTAFDPDDPIMLSGASPSSLGLEAVAEGTRWATLLASGYVTTIAGTDHVTGEACTVLASARGDGSLAAKIWISNGTGLVLQRQIFDAHGQLLRYSAFTELALVDDDDVSDVTTALRAANAPSSAGETLSAAQLSAARSTGVVAPETLAGSLTMVDARGFGTGTTATTQLTYSDGLSSMTVSEQRGRLPADPPPGWRRVTRDGTVVQQRTGSPDRVAWANRGTVFTVVSDTDEATLDAAVRALPRPAAGVTYAHRMRAGLDRIGSWLDPTH